MLKLLHLCDSLFPIGSFGYSDGLEAAVEAGFSRTDLSHWIDISLNETIGRLEAPIVSRAWSLFRHEDWTALALLDEESTALRPAAAIRKANRAMGQRLLTTWQALYPDPRAARALGLTKAGRVGPALPIAFAGAALCGGADRRATVEAFAYTRLASTVSAAMRLMAIGQTDAHGLLARALDRAPAIVDAAIARDADPETFTPLVDVATMRHQYLHSRLFRT
jgi:urease accessory protein